MHKKRYEIIVGIVVILAVIGVIIGRSIVSNKTVKSEYYDISVEFKQIGGLETGSTVLVNGVHCGKVKSIELKNSHVLIKISLQKNVTLYSDATILIREYGLMGARRIEIFQEKSEKKFDTSHHIQGTYMQGLHETISNINIAINNLNKIIKFLSKANYHKFETVLQRMNDLLTELNIIFKRNGEFRNFLKNSDKAISSIDSLFQKNKMKINNITSFTEAQIPQMKTLLTRLNMILEKINREDANFSRFTSSDSLYQKIYNTMDNLDSLLIDIKKNPKHYLKLF